MDTEKKTPWHELDAWSAMSPDAIHLRSKADMSKDEWTKLYQCQPKPRFPTKLIVFRDHRRLREWQRIWGEHEDVRLAVQGEMIDRMRFDEIIIAFDPDSLPPFMSSELSIWFDAMYRGCIAPNGYVTWL